MNKFTAVCLVFSSLVIASFAHAETINRVDIFIDSPIEIETNDHVHVWDLSLPQQTKTHYLPAHLSADPQIARQQMMTFMASADGIAFQHAMKDAYGGFVAMTKLKVQKVPAIVINEKFVVYGTTDIEKSLADYTHFSSTRR